VALILRIIYYKKKEYTTIERPSTPVLIVELDGETEWCSEVILLNMKGFF
jgi:hypothetical protein